MYYYYYSLLSYRSLSTFRLFLIFPARGYDIPVSHSWLLLNVTSLKTFRPNLTRADNISVPIHIYIIILLLSYPARRFVLLGRDTNRSIKCITSFVSTSSLALCFHPSLCLSLSLSLCLAACSPKPGINCWDRVLMRSH